MTKPFSPYPASFMSKKRPSDARGASPAPADTVAARQIDVAQWTEGALTQDCAIKLPPWLRPRYAAVQEDIVPYLLLRWHSDDGELQADEWLVAWLSGEPGFPAVLQYPAEWNAETVDHAHYADRAGGRELHIGSCRVVFPARHSVYVVTAYWALAKGKWIQLGAQARTHPKYLDVLAALYSVRCRSA